MIRNKKSSQGNPFGAVTDSGVIFVEDKVVAPIAAAYRAGDLATYRSHFPLVIGRLCQSAMQEIKALDVYRHDFPLFFDKLPIPSAIAGKADQLDRYLTRNLTNDFGSQRREQDLRQLAAVTAKILCGLTGFDAQWFGYSRETGIRMEHGNVSPNEGIHTAYKTAKLHRDGVKAGIMADRWRNYIMRTELCPSVLYNRDTDPLANASAVLTSAAQAQALGLPVFRAEGGEFVMLAAGQGGTWHESFVPQRDDKPKASYFLGAAYQP